MLRGLWKLTWLELKIFLREPLGVIGSIVVPVAVFFVLGRARPARGAGAATSSAPDLPIMAALFISLSAALSLVAILAIYREGGILKRLRATPLRPHTILSAHVLVKLLTTLATIVALMLAGKRYFPEGADVPYVPFALAVLFSTLSHPLDRLHRRQRRAHGALRAARRHAAVLSDGRALGAVLSHRGAAAVRAGPGSRPAGQLRRVADEGHLARRGVGGARGRSGGAGRGVR